MSGLRLMPGVDYVISYQMFTNEKLFKANDLILYE